VQARVSSPTQSELFSAPAPLPCHVLLESLNVDGLSPKEALEKFYELRQLAKEI